MRKVDVRELDGCFTSRVEMIGGTHFIAPYVKMEPLRYGESFWSDDLKAFIQDLQSLSEELDVMIEHHKIDHPEYYEEDEDEE